MKKNAPEGKWNVMQRDVQGWWGAVGQVVGFLPKKFAALISAPKEKSNSRQQSYKRAMAGASARKKTR